MILIQLKMISLKGTVDLVVFAGLCLAVLTFYGKGLNTVTFVKNSQPAIFIIIQFC